MISLEQIKEKMQQLYDEDSSRIFVEVTGSSLDEAISNAAVQLECPASRIDYEVMEKGISGFFAFNPRDWKIRAYEVIREKEDQEEVSGSESEEETVEQVVIEDKDGNAFIFCSQDGIYLKVTAPVGNGRHATESDVVEKLRDRALPIPDDSVLSPIVKNAAGEYTRISPFTRIPGNDAMMIINVSDDEMQAFLHVSPPGVGGADLSSDTITAFLKNNGIVVGINEERISAFQDMPVYGQDYLVAEGIQPKKGDDAKILYNFETDKTRVKLQETKSGKINFKDLNLIQNVVEGQPLAQKIPAQKGKHGKTVRGKYLEAADGKDIPMPNGKNTEIAQDGLTIIASINGQVLLVNKKINVEQIYVVNGDVSIKTGSFTFLGTVIVNGNVEDGYSIKASGNIEVKGTVGQADLDAEGDIVIGQGVVGRDGGSIRAGKSIWSKFIQNTKIVESGDMVIVSDGIINSNVIANRKIICYGKRADIIGGNLSASESISARNLGSTSIGNDTILNVGFDPRSKDRLNFLLEKQENDKKNLEDLRLNLNSLEDLRKRKGELPKEKEESFKKLTENKYIIDTEIQETQKEINQIKEYLNTLKIEGRVSASGNVYTGVRIVIRDIVEDVRTDCKATTFYLDNSFIRYGKYQDDNAEDAKKVPSGYSAN